VTLFPYPTLFRSDVGYGNHRLLRPRDKLNVFQISGSKKSGRQLAGPKGI
jgi:hypothetical protein